MRRIDFYFGLGSRYSYLAFTQVERIERAHACEFVLKPLSSVELMELRGRSPFEGQPISGQYEWDYRQRDAQAWAAYYGVPYIEPRRLPEDHRLMARACRAADGQGPMRAYCTALFRIVFAEHKEVNRGTCLALARSLNLDVHEFERAMDARNVAEQVRATAREAIGRGVFGVPSFVVDDRMFWGNDRLVLLEHYLASSARR